MKKILIAVFGIFSMLFVVGCSLDDSTSLGDDVIKDVDPSMVDISKNFQPFALDTSNMLKSFSIPDDDDVSFGSHISSTMPIGGKNGEIGTGYLEFRTFYSALANFKTFETIHSVSIHFDTVSSSKTDCNFSQEINVFHITDTIYKYNRNESNIKVLNSNVKSHTLNNEKFRCDFIDSTLHNKIFQACTSGTDSKGTKKEDLFKPDTFRFVIASNSDNSKFAYFKSSPYLRIHSKYGKIISDSSNIRDTVTFDTSRSVIEAKKVFAVSDTNYKTHFFKDTLNLDPLYKDTILIDSICTKVTIDDSTLNVIDTVEKILCDTIHRKMIRYSVLDSTDSIRISTKIDSIYYHKKVEQRLVRSVKFSSHTYTLPVFNSNYAVYEKSDTLKSRKSRAFSSFGPQRTTAFQIAVDSLWKKLNETNSSSGTKFSEILSAGIAITGTIDPFILQNQSNMSKDDSTIAFRWSISDKEFNNGLKIAAQYRSWAKCDTLQTGCEILLPVEKFFQELISHHPPTVYLYLELLNSGSYWKQVTWKKPVLKTVLTNIR